MKGAQCLAMCVNPPFSSYIGCSYVYSGANSISGWKLWAAEKFLANGFWCWWGGQGCWRCSYYCFYPFVDKYSRTTCLRALDDNRYVRSFRCSFSPLINISMGDKLSKKRVCWAFMVND